MACGEPCPTAVNQMVTITLHHLSVTLTHEITSLKQSAVQGIPNDCMTLLLITSNGFISLVVDMFR